MAMTSMPPRGSGLWIDIVVLLDQFQNVIGVQPRRMCRGNIKGYDGEEYNPKIPAPQVGGLSIDEFA